MEDTKKQRAIQHAMQNLDVLIRARYPVLYLLTHEEARLESLLAEIATKQSKQLFTWSAVQGLVRYAELNANAGPVRQTSQESMDPADALKAIQAKNVAALFVLKDFHPFLEDPLIVRRLREVALELKGTYKTIIIVSPRLTLPVELEKEITLLDIPLPDIHELGELLMSVCKTVAQKNQNAVNLTSADAWALARAAQGLTLTEAENVFSKAVVENSVIDRRDIGLVLEEKQQTIRKSGVLEFFATDSQMEDLGGLDNLKKWLGSRGRAFSNKAIEFGLPPPKGVLLLGAPGCGKSLTAKTISRAWELPLLRLDFGKIFSGLVGSSEENMRRALKVAEGVAPAVLWIDEIEKGLAGGLSGQSDGGAAARVFGTLLTWMQEKKSTVFVVATANRIDLLPPELLRRGRFDEVFFIDLPQAQARKEILSIQLKKRKRNPDVFDLSPVVQATEGFSGAELEHCVVEALFSAYNSKRDLVADDIAVAAKETIPLSVTYKEELEKTREWASRRARAADSQETRSDRQTRATRLEVRNEKKAV